MYMYYVKVVPTTYDSLQGGVLHTNQVRFGSGWGGAGDARRCRARRVASGVEDGRNRTTRCAPLFSAV